ncbi:beta-N-acetylhexosaminidase [Tessaracoccus sp.]
MTSGLVPLPVHTGREETGHYTLRCGSVITTHAALAPAVRPWARRLESAFGVDLEVLLDPRAPKVPQPDAGEARTGVSFTLGPTLPPGGYSVWIGVSGIVVECADVAGAHAATQSLRQLAGPQAFRASPTQDLDGVVFEYTHLSDHPRMAWRGVLLDVARHFLPKNSVLRFIDHAADHKLNVIQLHLTDDQGWRMQIQRYPNLTETGAWRTESARGVWQGGQYDGEPHGGFYTADDLREMVSYARARGITIVPEIDVPGHVEAAIAAYPHLGTRKQPHTVRTTWGMSTQVLDPSESSLDFFRHVLDEVLEIFDSPWVGLGGDEVPVTQWRADASIVARADDLGLADVSELHGWFLAQLCEHLLSAGRRPVVWDEGFSPLLPREAIVTSWRGFAAGLAALRAGHDVVMAPEQVVYLDHRAGPDPDEPVPVGFVRTVADVYAFEPLPEELLAAFPAETLSTQGHRQGTLLGAQAQVWTEHLNSQRRIDYATFPRLAAFAEVAWSPPQDRTPGSPASVEFLDRLTGHLLRLDAAGIEYRPMTGPLPWQRRPGVPGAPRDLVDETARSGWKGAGGWRESESVDPGVQS